MRPPLSVCRALLGMVASFSAYAATGKPVQNLSTQALSVGKSAPMAEQAAPVPEQALPKPRSVRAPARATFWNRPEAKAALTSKLTLGALDGKLAARAAALKPVSLSPPAPAAGACEPVQLTESPDCGCASYLMPDQVASGNISNWYLQPLHAFGSEQSARNFAATVTASLPLVYPFHDPSVHTAQGWFYGDGTYHGAIDFSKSTDQYGSGIDPTFAVHAAADGKVISVFGDAWSGNIVILEHVAPNGQKYRTSYFHLRNGYTHDLLNAKLTVAGSDPSSKPARYRKFAYLTSPSKQLWGTDQQKILVKPGDEVKRGQQLAWSGDTGPGGAGAGLNLDGTPLDPNTGNNHLHFMTAVPDPLQTGSWVQVDPFGVYGPLTNPQGANCYELSAGPAYDRLMAPFPPSFHDLPLDTFLDYWGYYTGMNMVLQTLMIERRHPGGHAC
jgi:murein DD-endopeptidase MepM/ murein hydrolase activator NlpD